MAGKLNLYQQDLKRFAEAAGEDLLPLMSPEERLRGLTPEERLRGLQAEERVRGLQAEEILRGLDADTREKLKELIYPDGNKN